MDRSSKGREIWKGLIRKVEGARRGELDMRDREGGCRVLVEEKKRKCGKNREEIQRKRKCKKVIKRRMVKKKKKGKRGTTTAYVVSLPRVNDADFVLI